MEMLESAMADTFLNGGKKQEKQIAKKTDF